MASFLHSPSPGVPGDTSNEENPEGVKIQGNFESPHEPGHFDSKPMLSSREGAKTRALKLLNPFSKTKEETTLRRKFKQDAQEQEKFLKMDRSSKDRTELGSLVAELRKRASSLRQNGERGLYNRIMLLENARDMTLALLDEYEALLPLVSKGYQDVRKSTSRLPEQDRKLKAQYIEGGKIAFEQGCASETQDSKMRNNVEEGRQKLKDEDSVPYEDFEMKTDVLENVIRTADLDSQKIMQAVQTSYEERLGALKQDIEDAKERHSGYIEELRMEHQYSIAKREKEHERQTSAHQQTCDDALAKLKEQLNAKQTEFEAGVDQVRQQFTLEENHLRNTISTMEIKHMAELEARDDKINQTSADMEQALEGKKQEYDQIIDRARLEHKAIEDGLGLTISAMEREHAKEREKYQTLLNQKLLEMKKAFTKDMADKEALYLVTERILRAEIASYSKVLLAQDKGRFNMAEQDHADPLSDAGIELRFADIVQEVDRLSRLEWKSKQNVWTTQVLQNISSNQRMLKKQILQDIIWTNLHDSVFCSPFRVFGEEGEALELQWNEQCGKDTSQNNGLYTWPKPRMETERWRYVTVRECRSVLRQPVPSQWDPRAALKKGFQATLEELKKKLISAFEEVVDLDKTFASALNQLVMKAARTWLEFGMQRCRVLILINGSRPSSVTNKLHAALENGLKLIITPGLKRYGNSGGENLDQVEVIGERTEHFVELKLTSRSPPKADR